MPDDIYKQLTSLQKQIDNLVKPEVPLGISLISETILSGSVTSVSFSSIPQTFNHLRLVIEARTDRAAENDPVVLRYNSDSGANYDRQFLVANNATLTGGANRASTFIQIGSAEAANSRASNFSPTESTILGYSRTDAEKWLLSRSAVFGDVSADADLFINLFAGRWRNTAAITTITLIPAIGTNFVSGSRFYLYGTY